MTTKFAILGAVLCCATLWAGDAPALAKPPLKIIPGQVIVPTDKMRRIWGELIGFDFAARTGTFRKEGTDEVLKFTVLPYAELLHHAAFGDVQDFRIGERAIFRLHENDAGEWVWLTYIQDQMNMMNGHKEYFYVDGIDAAKGLLTCTQANFDKSFVREKGILIETDKDTRYWKAGQPAQFADIKVGDKIRTKTHGAGAGKRQICWEVFLDDESLAKFQIEQKEVHAKRMAEDGLPGYADQIAGREIQLTLFQEAGELARTLKKDTKIRLAPAGIDRKPNGPIQTGIVAAAKMADNLCKVTVTLDADAQGFRVGELARLWIAP
jgi:hypothetical protein